MKPKPLCATLQLSPAPRAEPSGQLTGVEISPFPPRAPGGGPSAQPTGADVSPPSPAAGPSWSSIGSEPESRKNPPSPVAGPSWSSIGSEPESRKNSPALYHLAHAFLLVHLLP